VTEIITPAQAMPMAPTDLPPPDLFTDLANSYALIAMADRELRHTPGIGWHFWDGKRFQHDDGEVYVREAAKRAILAQRLRLEQRQADGLLTNGEVEAWQKWLKRSQNDGLLKSMLSVSRTDPRVVAYVRELDAHPNELNTQSGILDLDTFELRDHDPAALHTKVTRAGYDPNAVAPFWSQTIEKALPGPDVRRYVQKFFGQACRGSYSEHMLVAHGQTGSNLKSTIFGAVEDVLGDYAARASSDLLVDSTTGSARSDTAIAATRGVRYLLASETAEGVPFNDTLIKMMTGEHEITAKYMRQDYFTFSNQSAVALITNHRPRVQSSDEAIWRRLVLVPFEYVVPTEERLDPKEAQARLRAERDGILLWLIEGLRLWRNEGLREPPEAISDATASYRRESDPMSDWIDECVTFEDGAHERVTLVRSAYETHCQTSGRQPLGPHRFNATLERRGAKRADKRVEGVVSKSWIGLRLKTS
jgi:putative DNA primase/helicase